MKVRSYRDYLLIILLIALVFNNLDRFALGLVIQNIKHEFVLSDTQIGLLTGIAFAMFYSVMGIPIARWADRGNRVTILSLTTALWCGAVALCGLAGSFVQLLLVRIGVGVGEAGCLPTAHSLIADHFSRAERPRAVGRYMLGGPLGMVVAYLLAGWINELYGWRITFIVLGLPGLLLALLIRVSLREPRTENRTAGVGLPAHPTMQIAALAPLGFKEVYRFLWRNATFRHLTLYFSVVAFFGYGISQWKPAFFIRTYGLQTGEVGTWFALCYGVAGIVGTYLGGAWASRFAADNERLQLQAMAAATCGFAVVSACVYIAPNYYLAFALMAFASIGNAAVLGPLFASIQTLIPERMRAMAIATIYLLANLIGMGLGPLGVGALSDALATHFGNDSLRVALLALCPGYFWAALHLWNGSRTIGRDLAMMREHRGGAAMVRANDGPSGTVTMAPHAPDGSGLTTSRP